jgi:hypothetical protein
MNDLMKNIDFTMNLLFLIGETRLVDHFNSHLFVGVQRMALIQWKVSAHDDAVRTRLVNILTSVNCSELATAEHFNRIDFIHFGNVTIVRVRRHNGENRFNLFVVVVVRE